MDEIPKDILSEVSSFLGSLKSLELSLDVQCVGLCLLAVKFSKTPRNRKNRWLAKGIMYAVIEIAAHFEASELLKETILVARRVVN